MTTDTDTLRSLVTSLERKTGQRAYEKYHCGNSAEHCNKQLDRRSYYYNDGNRRFFNCRVLEVRTFCNGLLLGTVESVKPPEGSRVFRAVIFDLLGYIVHRSVTSNPFGWKTSKTALKELLEVGSNYNIQVEAARVLELAIRETTDKLGQLNRE